MPPENHLILQRAMTGQEELSSSSSEAHGMTNQSPFTVIYPVDPRDHTYPSCNSYFLQEVLKISKKRFPYVGLMLPLDGKSISICLHTSSGPTMRFLWRRDRGRVWQRVLFHWASNLLVCMKRPWESCPCLSGDTALRAGSLSHLRYRLWFVMGSLFNSTRSRAKLPCGCLLIVLENVKGAQSKHVVLVPHVIRAYLFKTPWRRAGHCQLTKTTNMNRRRLKRKAAQWINKAMAPQGQDMNDKKACSECEAREVRTGHKHSVTFNPGRLQLQRWQVPVCLRAY